MTTHPENGDVIVHHKHDPSATAYVLGVHFAPDQFIVATRKEAISRALAYAQHQRVRAWVAKGRNDFVLLATYRKEEAEAAISLTLNQRCEVCGGSLVPPGVLGPQVTEPSRNPTPDYLCIECQRPYVWRGTPRRLIMGAAPE